MPIKRLERTRAAYQDDDCVIDVNQRWSVAREFHATYDRLHIWDTKPHRTRPEWRDSGIGDVTPDGWFDKAREIDAQMAATEPTPETPWGI